MRNETIRVRCVAESAGANIYLPSGELSSIVMRKGDVAEIADSPSLHIERYRSKEHPGGWPAHLFERVGNDVRLTIDPAAARYATAQN